MNKREIQKRGPDRFLGHGESRKNRGQFTKIVKGNESGGEITHSGKRRKKKDDGCGRQRS